MTVTPSVTTARRATVVTAVAAALIGGTAVSASASTGTQEPGMAAQMVSAINSERAGNGSARLGVSSALTAAAQRWAASMASRNSLSHNPNLAGEVSGWQSLGENVGYGSSVPTLVQTFWGSAPHRANILDRRFTLVGVGVVQVGHTLWVAEEFERPAGAGSAPSHPTSAPRVHSTHRSSSPARKPKAKAAKPAPVRWQHPNRCPITM